jgi:DNA modification methylase
MFDARILVGDVRDRLRELSDQSVRTCVTSPPYWNLRDYGHDGQIGLEETPDRFVDELVQVFREVRRVLTDDGTLWLNLGDSYLKEKQLGGIPWRVAFALQADGWFLRQDIIWAKPNPMPESVTDRCTKAHEYVFLLSKSPQYFFDAEAIKEPLAESSISRLSQDIDAQTGSERANGGRKTNGTMKAVGPRFGGNKYGDSKDSKHATKSGNVYEPNGKRNKRSVWSIATKPFKDAHFAVMPEALAEPCVLAGSEPGDLVLDPFSGAGTVGVVATRNQRNYVGFELNSEYVAIAEKRLQDQGGMLVNVLIDERVM